MVNSCQPPPIPSSKVLQQVGHTDPLLKGSEPQPGGEGGAASKFLSSFIVPFLSA